MKIQVNHIGKMEGHTDFVAEILKGDVKSAKMMTTEGARLIEGILVGRHFNEAPIITSRICGICPVVHKLSSIKALEVAFKIKPSHQTIQLRKLMLMGQIIHSHALHLFFLSLPDFFDLESDLDFMAQNKKETNDALELRRWALELVEVVGGRAVHPIACEVGGFKVLPNKNELADLLKSYDKVLKSALSLVNLSLKIKLPQFGRPTTFVALTNPKEYAFYDGDLEILSVDGKSRTIPAIKFTKNIKEIEEPYRAAKSATLDGESFMVGALARLNIHGSQLNPLALGIFKKLGWPKIQYNTFNNIIAQAIEIVHCLEESKKLLGELSYDLREETSKSRGLKVISGANPVGRSVSGCDCLEAPRGTLYHSYNLNRDGIIDNCQIITPTVSFLKNLEADLLEYLPDVMSLPERKRAIKIRSLIRTYDPCISCATH